MINLDDPGIAIALLAIIVGLRLALYVTERFLVKRPLASATSSLAPDDAADDVSFALNERPAVRAALTTPPATTDPHPFRFFTELLDSALIAVVLVFFLIRPFVLQAFFIPSGSMMPTLQQGDKLLATKYSYRLREPRHGEIVVFHAPRVALETLGQTYDAQQPIDYVKRVVGLPTDRIKIVRGVGVFVNGKRWSEPYVAALPDYDFPQEIRYNRVRVALQSAIRGDELVVPKGYLFVLGDNRNLSHDSHAWGLLPRKALVGKAVFIFWPPNRFGFVH